MHTPQQIDQAFKALEKSILGNKKEGTSCNDVLHWLYENQDKVWVMSWEVVGQVTKNGRYLSHRAPARLSDLALNDPHLVEDRKLGRYKAYRLRTENINLVEARLGKKEIVEKPKKPKNPTVEIVMIDGKPVAKEIYA